MKVILKQQMIRTKIRIIRIVKIVADISATIFYFAQHGRTLTDESPEYVFIYSIDLIASTISAEVALRSGKIVDAMLRIRVVINVNVMDA